MLAEIFSLSRIDDVLIGVHFTNVFVEKIHRDIPFIDKKIFTIEEKINRQNDRI